MPIAGFAVIENEQLYMQGRVGSPDGKQLIKAEITGAPEQAEQLGEQLAQQLLAQGAGAILAALYA